MLYAIGLLFLIGVFIIFSVVIVPQQKAYIVERLGKYHNTFNAGMHFIIPFVDKVRAKINLSEEVLEIAPQVCITKDNTQVSVDGILYIQVIDPKTAVYGTNNYRLAVANLSQTTLRSVIGKMNLDDTVESRETINSQVVGTVDDAAVSWGVKLMRYEIKDLAPPVEILKSMQDQITAERNRRAKVIQSEGERIEQINIASGKRESDIKISEGEAQATINSAEAEKQAKIKAAEGEAESIRLVAEAKAEAIRIVAEAISKNEGGQKAVDLNVAEQYIAQYGNLAKESTTIITPANPMDASGMVASALSIMNNLNQDKSKS